MWMRLRLTFVLGNAVVSEVLSPNYDLCRPFGCPLDLSRRQDHRQFATLPPSPMKCNPPDSSPSTPSRILFDAVHCPFLSKFLHRIGTGIPPGEEAEQSSWSTSKDVDVTYNTVRGQTEAFLRSLSQPACCPCAISRSLNHGTMGGKLGHVP